MRLRANCARFLILIALPMILVAACCSSNKATRLLANRRRNCDCSGTASVVPFDQLREPSLFRSRSRVALAVLPFAPVARVYRLLFLIAQKCLKCKVSGRRGPVY